MSTAVLPRPSSSLSTLAAPQRRFAVHPVATRSRMSVLLMILLAASGESPRSSAPLGAPGLAQDRAAPPGSPLFCAQGRGKPEMHNWKQHRNWRKGHSQLPDGHCRCAQHGPTASGSRPLPPCAMQQGLEKKVGTSISTLIPYIDACRVSISLIIPPCRLLSPPTQAPLPAATCWQRRLPSTPSPGRVAGFPSAT